MKRLSLVALVAAVSLTGCGSIPGLSLFGSEDSTETSTAQQSFYAIMGVDDTGAETASGSVRQPGGANLGQLLFDLLDANADGSISDEEFSGAVRTRRPTATDAEISGLFAQLDRNGDSAIALEELQPKARAQKDGRGDRGGRMGPPPRHHHFGPPPGGEAPEGEEAPEEPEPAA